MAFFEKHKNDDEKRAEEGNPGKGRGLSGGEQKELPVEKAKAGLDQLSQKIGLDGETGRAEGLRRL